MRAVWCDRQGAAADVLQVGELPDPEPGPGEVRVRVRLSGINPGDTKKRRGWLGSTMPYPRVVPHSDAAGSVDAVGAGVDPARVGRRVWVFGAQSYRPSGTAAEWTVVPAGLAVDLPDEVGDELGACLGIPASARTGRSSATARSPGGPSWCRACWAGSGRWRRSWPAGAGPR